MPFFMLIIGFLASSGLSTFAYEVDNFTDRDQLTVESLPKMDSIVNSILSRASNGVHKERGKECNPVFLRQEILRWIRPDPTGQIEVWLELTDEIQHTRKGIWKSIYQDIGFKDSPILSVVGIGRSFLLNGQIIGSDKVGHFFMQGLDYFKWVKEGKPIEKVLRENHQEDGLWGLATSGVKSYADMATNYQGYRFWSQLTEGEKPYFTCDEKSGWIQNRKFTWADYVNPAWDEAINCSEMRPAIQAKVDEYLNRKGWHCPIKPEECATISKIENAEYFISPRCKAIARNLTP